MTITLGYGLAILQQARGSSPLEVRQGLAVTFHWVARAEVHLNLALDADGQPARTMTAVLNGPGPGQRAALRALLDDAEYKLDRPPGLRAAPLAISSRLSTDAALGLHEYRSGVALCIARAHAALIGEGDTLLGVRRRPSVYVLVVRGGTVLAAIRGAPAPGADADQLRRRLPVVPAGP